MTKHFKLWICLEIGINKMWAWLSWKAMFNSFRGLYLLEFPLQATANVCKGCWLFLFTISNQNDFIMASHFSLQEKSTWSIWNRSTSQEFLNFSALCSNSHPIFKTWSKCICTFCISCTIELLRYILIYLYMMWINMPQCIYWTMNFVQSVVFVRPGAHSVSKLIGLHMYLRVDVPIFHLG